MHRACYVKLSGATVRVLARIENLPAKFAFNLHDFAFNLHSHLTGGVKRGLKLAYLTDDILKYWALVAENMPKI